MAVKKRGLGRGLDALLSGPSVSALEEQAVKIDQKELQHLPVELVQRGKYQPRRDMDPEALEELAHSIRNHGVMQPIVVRPIGDNRYEIIAGERRWRATQQAGLDTIPAMVREVPDEAAFKCPLRDLLYNAALSFCARHAWTGRARPGHIRANISGHGGTQTAHARSG